MLMIKRKKQRDREHIFNNDSVSNFAKEHDVQVPEMKILETELTVEEGAKKEGEWVNKYKKNGWEILNRTKTGSIGGLGKGKSRYTRDICQKLASECTHKSDFKSKHPQAYKVSFNKGCIKDYTWFKDGKIVGADKRRKYDYQTCYEEAKNYKTITEFENGNKGACRAARVNGWMKDYNWFTLLWEKKWDKETCYEEAKKYTTLDDFISKANSCYATACKNKWIDDYIWLERKRTRRCYWQDYDNCYNEALKYKTRTELKRNSSGCYNACRENGWIDDFDWLLTNPNQKWCYEACYMEAKQYKSLKDFIQKSRSAYNSALKNGWLSEYVWLERSAKNVSPSEPSQIESEFDNIID